MLSLLLYLYILLCKASRYAQPWVVAIKKTTIIITRQVTRSTHHI